MKNIIIAAATVPIFFSVLILIFIVSSSVSSLHSSILLLLSSKGFGSSDALEELFALSSVCIFSGLISTAFNPYNSGVRIPASQGSKTIVPSIFNFNAPIPFNSHTPLF